MTIAINNNELRERVWGHCESVEHPNGGKVWLRPPEMFEIALLHRLLHTEISPQAGTLETMQAVFAHNRDSFWIVERSEPGSNMPAVVGFYSFLPLNASGRAALETQSLDRTAPPLSLLASYGEAPAALYIWAIVARGLVRRMMPLIARAMGLLYANAPIYAFVATEDGRKAGVGVGFSPSGAEPQVQLGSLMRLPPWSGGGALA